MTANKKKIILLIAYFRIRLCLKTSGFLKTYDWLTILKMFFVENFDQSGEKMEEDAPRSCRFLQAFAGP
jgi:hypothetical protein